MLKHSIIWIEQFELWTIREQTPFFVDAGVLQLNRQVIYSKMDKKSIVQSTGEQDSGRVYKIQLTNKSIKEMLPLKQYQKLRCLVLSYNLIDRIDNLHNLTDLRELHLENNLIAKLSGLESNKNLQLLNLATNRIERIENIAHLIRLETLMLDGNNIAHLSGLEYLKELKTLSVCKNRIESIENLPAFSKLEVLLLNHNKIKNVSNNLLVSSKSLVVLDLSSNCIESTAFLQNLPNLQTLNLSRNRIKELQAPELANLQTLNLFHNQIERLPPLGICFPELVVLNIASNLICSELDVHSALAETNYLTEIDFRDNPIYNLTFEAGLQRIHSFDFVNGKVMTKAGSKYYNQAAKIQQDLTQNSELYGEDDEKDRQIKMSGFFDQQLESKMSGMKVNRPSSPPKKKKNLEKATFYEDLDRGYNEFMQNDRRIKFIRERYLKICGDYDIKSSQLILTEVPVLKESTLGRQASIDVRAEERNVESSNRLSSEADVILKQNERNLNKWKELKQREKSFNIREVIKKSRGKESSVSRGGSGAATNANWTNSSAMNAVGSKQQKRSSELFKTQMVPRKMGDELLKTLRPNSVRRKQ